MLKNEEDQLNELKEYTKKKNRLIIQIIILTISIIVPTLYILYLIILFRVPHCIPLFLSQ